MGAEESVEKSKEFMNMAMEAKDEMDSLRAKHKVDGFQGEAVCEVCGVKYPLGGGGADWHDETSHWKGKAHTGYTEIRATVGRLRNKRKEWDKYRDKIESNKRRVKDKEREKDRQKDKERRKLEREREKEREKERELEREREKALEKKREKERIKREAE